MKSSPQVIGAAASTAAATRLRWPQGQRAVGPLLLLLAPPMAGVRVPPGPGLYRSYFRQAISYQFYGIARGSVAPATSDKV